MCFIQRTKFNVTIVTSDTIHIFSDAKVFPECFLGPMKTLRWAT